MENTQTMKKPESEWHLTNDRPVFIQIMEKLKRDIVTGSYRPGDKLPSVRELAAEAAVNPNTMQRAFSELEREGLVYTKRTNGRFITEDETMIKQLQEKLAREQVDQFFARMEQLGVSRVETLRMLQAAAQENEGQQRESA